MNVNPENLPAGDPSGPQDGEDAAVRQAHIRLSGMMAEDRDGEDPTDPDTVQAMPVVMEFPKSPLPDRRALLEAAATACVAVCLDTRAGGEGDFAQALLRWYGARIRKIVRRARNSRWLDVQELPGVTAFVRSPEGGVASARAFVPCPVGKTPAPVAKLQIQGADLEPGPGYAEHPEEVLSGDTAPVIYVDASLAMTVGKAAAQVGHGSMLLAAAMDTDSAVDWASRGFPLHVCEVDRSRFAEVRTLAEKRAADGSARAAAVVQDAGYTEVAPGSVTVVALQRDWARD